MFAEQVQTPPPSSMASVIVTKNYYQTESIPNTLQLMEDDIVHVLSKPNDYWWDGILVDPVGNITRGWFPASYTRPYTPGSNSSNNRVSRRDELIQGEARSSSQPQTGVSSPLSSTAHGIHPSQNAHSQQHQHHHRHIFNSHNLQSGRGQPIKSRQAGSHHSSHCIHRSHSQPYYNPKSSINHSEISSGGLHHHHSQHQVSISTIKSESSQSNISSPSIFKEKNYFVPKTESALASSLTTQFQYGSRQSSQAHTDTPPYSMMNSIHMVTNEEISSYFKPSTSESQPSFNFVPIWLPQFTVDNQVVYKNQALKVFSKDIPFIDADYLNEESVHEAPDTSNLQADLNPLPISLKRQNTGSSLTLTPPGNSAKSSSVYDTLHGSVNKCYPQQTQVLINMPDFANIRLTEFFYTDNTDILTWDALSTKFINSIDESISALEVYDQQKFKTLMNECSNCVSLLQTAGRLIHQHLIDSNKLTQFNAILKKITNMFIQFRIWTTLALVSHDHMMDASKSSKTLEIAAPEKVTKSKLESYRADSLRCRQKIEKLLSHLCLVTASLSDPNQNGIFKKSDSKILPMVYPRFVRDKFEGGNFKNKFIDAKYSQSDFFSNTTQNQVNILLDDEALNKLNSSERKILDSLNEVQGILSSKMSKDSSLTTFMDDRNLKLLAAIYHCIPHLCSFINTVESIDLTVFAMINKLAAKNYEPERQNTIVSRNDSLPPKNANNERNTSDNSIPGFIPEKKGDMNFSSINLKDENDTGTDSSEELDRSSQSFYDATAKVFRPMISEFLYLKQLLHSAFTDLILDSQTITTTDPETFFPIEKDRPSYGNSASKTKQLTEVFLKQLELINSEIYHDGIYTLEPNLKLLETIKLSKERMRLISVSVTQLKDERRSILNYCSRLMNTDFNIASLFIAERHNTLVSMTSQSTQNIFTNKSTSTMNSGLDGIDSAFDSDGKGSNKVNQTDVAEWPETDSIPWYMGADHDEEELIYETSTLRGGPVRGLVAKLVNPINPTDELYEQTFFCFFSTFVKPLRLFEILIEKYHIAMPDALSYEEYGIWLEQKLKPQQKNVLSAFEKLFSKYWIVKYTTPELVNLWENFVDETPSISSSLVNLASKVFSFRDQEEYIEYFNLGDPGPKQIPMSPLTPTIKHLRLQTMSIMFVAEQITAVQAFYYGKINLWDLLGRTYNFSKILHKKKDRNGNNLKDPLGTKNISTFVKNCNNLTHFTTYMILRRSSEERVSAIKYFISLAEKLLSLKNFSSMTAIISGLGSTSISRLRKTWDAVPISYVVKFQKMDNLMSIGKNYSEYRNILRFMETDDDPYLPFLGMYLSDLRFTTDGNPDWLSSKEGTKGLVNYSKRTSIMKIIREILNFNETSYKIKLDPDFSCYLHEMFSGLPDDEKLYELSIEIEPRVSLLKNIKSTLPTTAAPISSVSSAGSAAFGRLFNAYGNFGSVSTTGSTQRDESLANLNNSIGGGSQNSIIGKKQESIGASRRPKRYRALYSLNYSDKDKEREKEKNLQKTEL